MKIDLLTVTESGISLIVDHVLDFVLSADLRLSVEDNSSLAVTLHNREKKQVWTVHYTCSNQLLNAQVLTVALSISLKMNFGSFIYFCLA